MCLRVIGNYGMNSRPNPKQDQTHMNFSRHAQMKNENPYLPPTSQKIKTIFYFFLIRFLYKPLNYYFKSFLKLLKLIEIRLVKKINWGNFSSPTQWYFTLSLTLIFADKNVKKDNLSLRQSLFRTIPLSNDCIQNVRRMVVHDRCNCFFHRRHCIFPWRFRWRMFFALLPARRPVDDQEPWGLWGDEVRFGVLTLAQIINVYRLQRESTVSLLAVHVKAPSRFMG